MTWLGSPHRFRGLFGLGVNHIFIFVKSRTHPAPRDVGETGGASSVVSCVACRTARRTTRPQAGTFGCQAGPDAARGPPTRHVPTCSPRRPAPRARLSPRAAGAVVFGGRESHVGRPCGARGRTARVAPGKPHRIGTSSSRPRVSPKDSKDLGSDPSPFPRVFRRPP